MEKKLFLDTDGVLRDFVGACEKRWDIKFDFSTDVKSLQKLLSFSDERWNRALQDSAFWETMPPTKDAIEILRMCMKYFEKENIFIVSSSPLNEGVLAWYKKYLPRYYKDQRIIFIKDKSLLAGRHTVLIDDFAKQCHAFMNKGGWAILYPRIWNLRTHAVHRALEAVEEELRLILTIKEEE